ncbi:hypothetical protein ACFRAI_33315 [Streptomyces sp. NPDC056637]|uniref:hypothetical protein n=1 Tax=unclassified Streptomyces TaxID=2593676 RepID=UPI0036C5542B
MDVTRADVDAVHGEPEDTTALTPEAVFMDLVGQEIGADERVILTAEEIWNAAVERTSRVLCGVEGDAKRHGYDSMPAASGEQQLQQRLEE